MNVNIAKEWRTVVLQPTSLCNLNCDYCYLPDRKVKSFMREEIAVNVAKTLSEINKKITVLWHGGEPLMTGIRRFESYTRHFKKLVDSNLCIHNMQTNATLINDNWCSFFKDNNFSIGVSIDGSKELNKSRKYWNGKGAYDGAIKGIDCLRKNNVKFSIIGVVNRDNITEPEKFYEYISSLGSYSMSINVEEIEGLNSNKEAIDSEQVQEFWDRLFIAWQKKPVLTIRHFKDAINIMDKMITSTDLKLADKSLYPTIDTQGNVILMSPELASAPLNERQQFIVGNVLTEDLSSIVEKGREAWYVKDFMKGALKCFQNCPYFAFCRGGQPSNKWFECKTFDTTETNYCINARQAPVNSIIKYL